MAGSRESKHVRPMVFPSQLARRGRGEELAALDVPGLAGGGAGALTLQVADTSQPGSPVEVAVFRQASVTLGRSRSCDQRLEDRKQVVSGRHARIAIEDGKLWVTDLGSRNFTYLDGLQLEPGRAYEIAPGGTVAIGEFEIRAHTQGAADDEPEPPTLFEAGYINPFRDGAAALAEALARLRELFGTEAPGRREQALREALDEALGSDEAAAPWQWIASSESRESDSG